MSERKSHNFLVPHPLRRASRGAFFVLAIIGGVLAIVVLLLAFVGSRVYADAQHGRALLVNAEAAAATLDFDTALTDTERAGASFVVARRYLKVLSVFSYAPVLGPHIVAADRALSSGISAASAAQDVCTVGRDLLVVAKQAEGLHGSLFTGLMEPSASLKDVTREQKRSVLAAFAASSPKLHDALKKIDAALASFDQIPISALAIHIQKELAPIRQKLLDTRGAIAAIEPIAGALPAVLGYPNAKHYLFFFQNNTELRPTGGFLGVFGALTVQDAEIAEMATSDVYAIDGPAESSKRPLPPAPIRKYIGIDKWYLRDANWSPDFPTSAQTMQQFFREESAIALAGKPNPPIDGIIAITPKFAEDILRLTGPITVDGKTFTADNLVDTLEFEVEQGFAKSGVPFWQRKNIIGDLVHEITNRFSSFSLARLTEVVGVVAQDSKEKQIFLYASDPALQSTFISNGWAGELKPVRDDYLMYVDANLAALKTDSVIDRDLRYSITPASNGEYDGKVTMTYHNKGSFTWKTTRYRTYARLYVPPGTVFTGVSGAMKDDKLKNPGRDPGAVDVSDELGRRVFGAFIAIEPGETKSLEFRFRLSSSIASMIKKGEYALDVQKQGGTVAPGLTLDLDFGKKLSNAEPPEDRSKWGDTRYTFGTDLRIDRAFALRF